MGQSERVEWRATAGSCKQLAAHIDAYTTYLMGVVVKAALQDGLSQRETAQLLQLSKSKVNRLARSPLGMLVDGGDPFMEIDRAIDDHLLGEESDYIWRMAEAYVAEHRQLD